jgi:alkylhydroperoxidase family enzyme
VTRAPWTCTRADVDRLRAAGATDAEIHAAVQVIAYFNYINRVADALGVDPET